jgi:hypothetical protein
MRSCLVLLDYTAPDCPRLQAGQLSEEMCTCWALINLRRCCELARELEVAVPLYYGSIYDPQLLHNLAAEKRR